MEYETQEFEYGIKLEMHSDDDPGNPREQWDHVGTMICAHRSYNLGDEQVDTSYYEDWVEIIKDKTLPEDVVLPLYLYDHSGISMSTSSASFRAFDSHGWDWGTVGFIYVTKEQIDKEWNGDRDKAEEYLRGEVAEYDQYLTGDVWGYVVEDEEGNLLDSCWGFYGYEYAQQEGLSMVQYWIDQRASEEAAALLPIQQVV